MPGFVQIMEFDTSNIDGVDDLGRRLQAELGDKFLARRATTTEDRDRPGHYYVIVEFDSYDEAMANSDNPLTSKYAEDAGKLLDGPTTFHNLDVVTVMDWR